MLKAILVLGFGLGASAMADDGSWTDKLKMSGDLRIRHDYTKRDGRADRHRERYRLRLATTAKVNDRMQAKVRLASGESGDPVSTNATMSENSTKKSIYIDQAAVDWKISDSLSFILGKQENLFRPLPSSQLVFDSDYTPEGAAVDMKFDSIMLKLGGFTLQERTPASTGDEPESHLLSALIGFKSTSESGSGFMVGAGYHTFTNLQDNAALTTFAGNSTVSGGTRYKDDYQVVELLAEYSMKMQDCKVSVFANGIQNTHISEDNRGVLAGANITTLKESDKADWTLGYNYRAVDKDATVSSINDSDFANGEDGSHGHQFSVGKSVMDKAQVSLNYYVANVDNNGSPYKTERGLLDFQVSF